VGGGGMVGMGAGVGMGVGAGAVLRRGCLYFAIRDGNF